MPWPQQLAPGRSEDESRFTFDDQVGLLTSFSVLEQMQQNNHRWKRELDYAQQELMRIRQQPPNPVHAMHEAALQVRCSPPSRRPRTLWSADCQPRLPLSGHVPMLFVYSTTVLDRLLAGGGQTVSIQLEAGWTPAIKLVSSPCYRNFCHGSNSSTPANCPQAK